MRRKSDQQLAGVVNVSEPVMRAFQSAYLGFYAFAGMERQGLMTEGLALVLDAAFDQAWLPSPGGQYSAGQSCLARAGLATGLSQRRFFAALSDDRRRLARSRSLGHSQRRVALASATSLCLLARPWATITGCLIAATPCASELPAPELLAAITRACIATCKPTRRRISSSSGLPILTTPARKPSRESSARRPFVRSTR